MAEGEVATVVESWKETPALTSVRLSVSPALAAQHRHPGQYVLAEVAPGLISPFALASTPGEPELELLFGREVQQQLGGIVPRSFPVSSPQGAGFPIERAEGHDVVIFAAGSGMSAVRPLLEVIRDRRDAFLRVVLFAGARSEEEHVYRGWDVLWREAAIDVRRSVGRPYVQDLFAAAPLALDRAFVFAAGMDPMITALRTMLVEQGLDPARFALNF